MMSSDVGNYSPLLHPQRNVTELFLLNNLPAFATGNAENQINHTARWTIILVSGYRRYLILFMTALFSDDVTEAAHAWFTIPIVVGTYLLVANKTKIVLHAALCLSAGVFYVWMCACAHVRSNEHK